MPCHVGQPPVIVGQPDCYTWLPTGQPPSNQISIVYSIIYIWKIIEGLTPNFSNPITSTFLDVEAGHASFPMSM